MCIDGLTVSAEDQDLGAQCTGTTSHGYPYIPGGRCGKIVYLHHSIGVRLGFDLSSGVIDHIDGNPKNNVRSNLRVIRSGANTFRANRKCNRKYDLPRGVYMNRTGSIKPYYARIRVDEDYIHLGSFADISSAETSYKEACLKYYGELPGNYK